MSLTGDRNLPTILITNKSDDSMPLGLMREWAGVVPTGWAQVGYVEANGTRHLHWKLEEER